MSSNSLNCRNPRGRDHHPCLAGSGWFNVFESGNGIHPAGWCPASPMVSSRRDRTDVMGSPHARSARLAKCVAGCCGVLVFVPMNVGTLQTGFEASQTVSKVRRDTSGVISDFAKKGQDLSFGNCVSWRQNFSKSYEVRQDLPNKPQRKRGSVVWRRLLRNGEGSGLRLFEIGRPGAKFAIRRT